MDSGTGRKVEIDGLEILLVRIDDDIYAISDTCSHADVSLSNGFVEADDCAVECPSTVPRSICAPVRRSRCPPSGPFPPTRSP